ncbi:MAG: hypothetical protein Roseis2KO_16070 [Roseivirga sp.]
MKETKPNILKAALKLFNSQGFMNVRLQHIADEAFVSVGNLAYHFEGKEQILLALYQEFSIHQRNLLKELSVVPLFEQLDRHWDNTLSTQQAYKFFYIDTLELHRNNETIARQHQEHIRFELGQLQHVIQFNISRGAFQELDHATVIRLSHLLWACENSWVSQSFINDGISADKDVFKEYLWLLLKPYFTERGKQEYQQLLDLKNSPRLNY